MIKETWSVLRDGTIGGRNPSDRHRVGELSRSRLLLNDQHIVVVVQQPVADTPRTDDLLQSTELASTEDDEIRLVRRGEGAERFGGCVGVGDEERHLALWVSSGKRRER